MGVIFVFDADDKDMIFRIRVPGVPQKGDFIFHLTTPNSHHVVEKVGYNVSLPAVQEITRDVSIYVEVRNVVKKEGDDEI